MDISPSTSSIKLNNSWRQQLAAEFTKPYMVNLKQFLVDQLNAKKIIYPKAKDYFAALDATPFEKVHVVILGQDPYHGPRQAHGLCFSVQPGVDRPPSLQNIYKELESDLGVKPVHHGFLQHWAQQGVLLLNATLSVEAGRPGSHQGHGWEQFTDQVIDTINNKREHVVFMLWGSYAQKKGERVDPSRHLVLKAPHPSPLSCHRGFFGCRHFSKANAYLVEHGQQAIDWQLPTVVG